ncbi:MAG: DNA repair protein RadA, partial [Clostridiales Family XIII bacterium]|nr:DNA repair protein RadA [Clostridiales Family XIII bacterium]
MAKKDRAVFLCQECGYESPKWMGQCVCGAWNSFVEERAAPARDGLRPRSAAPAASAPQRLADVRPGAYERLGTGLSELDRVLGGGLVKGSLTLI